MLAMTQSGALQGVTAQTVTIEVNSGERGELKYILVGLPDSAVKESQDRVFSALGNCGFNPPTTKTTINLAPGDLKKKVPPMTCPSPSAYSLLPSNAKPMPSKTTSLQANSVYQVRHDPSKAVLP